MNVSDLVPILLGAGWIFLPGALLSWALGCRDWIVYVGGSAPASIGLLSLSASILAILGISFDPLPVAALLAVLVLAGRLGRAVRTSRHTAHATGSEVSSGSTATAPDGPATARSPRLLGAVGLGLLAGSAAVAAWTWWRGIGPLSTYNQDHDSIHHQLLTAYIERTGRAAPWEVLPVDLLSGEPVHFYPAGMHIAAALTGDPFGNPIIGLNVALIVFCGATWALGTAALTAVVLRRYRMPVPWQLAGAGATALAAAGLYRPAFQLVRDNGVMANAVALVLVPGVVATLLSLQRWRSAATVTAGLACAGAVAVHPSAVVSVFVTFVAVFVGSLRVWARRGQLLPFLGAVIGAGVLALVLSIPVLLGALGAAGQTADFPPDVSGVPISQSLGAITTLVYGGFLLGSENLNQMVLFVLLILGIVICLLWRRAEGLVLAWLVWVALAISAYWSPTTGLSGPIAGFFYNSAGRIQGHVYLLVPSLCAVALLGAVALVARLAGRWTGFPRLALLAPLVLVLLGAGYALGPLAAYARANYDALNDRYYQPEFYRVDANDKQAAQWLAEHISPGMRVMNSANDGSTYAYVEYGVPLVNIFTLGVEEEPYTFELLESFNELDSNAAVRRLVLRLDIQYVYVDAGAPIIGSAYSPDGWYKAPEFTVAPGLQDLQQVQGLHLAYQAGAVSIWSVDRAELADIGA